MYFGPSYQSVSSICVPSGQHGEEEEEGCDELREPQGVEAVEHVRADARVHQLEPQRLQGSTADLKHRGREEGEGKKIL